MKASKALFIIAGIAKSIFGALLIIFGLFSFLFGGLIKTMFTEVGELVEELIENLASASEKYQYLLSNSVEQNVEFIMGIVNALAIFALIWGLIFITLAVINFMFSKFNLEKRKMHKKQGTVFVVFSWLLTIIDITNILTTVAMYIRLEPKKLTN